MIAALRADRAHGRATSAMVALCFAGVIQAAEPAVLATNDALATQAGVADRLQVRLARELYNQRRFAESEQLLQSLADRLALDAEGAKLWGDLQRERNDLDAALHHYQAAARLQPNDAGLQLRLAQVFRRLARDADADAAIARYEVLSTARLAR